MKIRFLCLLFVVGILISCSRDRSAIWEVSAGQYDRVDTPIMTILPEKWKDFPYFSLENLDTGNFIPVQRLGKDELVFILDDPMDAGEKRQYQVRPLIVDPHEDYVHIFQNEREIQVTVKGKSILNYHIADALPPPGSPDYYRRSGFIHPLFSPGGNILTDDFPPDHMHQHGIFFAWTNGTYKGKKIDFWNQHKGTGGVRHVEMVDTLSGSVYGQFTSRLHHLSYVDQDTIPVINESWKVQIYRLTDHFLVDFKSVHTCAGVEPLQIGTYKYGGLGIRGARQWYPGPDSILPYPLFSTDNGDDRITGDHTSANWVNMEGPIHGNVGGFTVMNHPQNFRSPQPVRLHPEMPYFSYAPVVGGDFTIEPGTPYTSRYRFWVHEGKADEERIRQVWHDYEEPPEVVWVSI